MRRTGLLLLALTLWAATCPADTQLDLGTAKLSLDDRGYVTTLHFSDGTQWPAAGQPAFWIETERDRLFPQSVKRSGDKLNVAFSGGFSAEFQVVLQPGLAVFELVRLAPQDGVKQFHLFSLPIPKDGTLLGTLNGVEAGAFAAAVMAAEPNVQAVSDSAGGQHGDRAGCSHQFVPTEEAKVGRRAARFTASSNEVPGGWSVVGKPLFKPLDLTGCKAIRAWVHGDGKKQALKIQLTDNRGGYRDNYLTIDFTGWRQVTLSDSPVNSLRYDQVRTVSFYYNSLPPSQTVSCLIDQVEAIVDRQGKEETVLLEDFESPHSPLWSSQARSLDVRTGEKHGLMPARFGVLVAPKAELLDTVRRFELAARMPSPQLGGQWNKTSAAIKRSYFFLTSFGEDQFDQALAIARRGGFDMILMGQESWCHSTGHYEINRKHFPDGLEGLKRTIRKFKDAGFRVGLHFLGPSIYPPDPYLTPVPDPRLVKDAFTTLDADIDAKATTIPTATAPTDFPAEDNGYKGSGTVLQIGDELIFYGERSVTAPLGFAHCKRGYLGTKAAAHKKGQRVAHLLRSYGYHMFDMDTSLLDEVSANFAKVANACQIDMIYFDGSERLQGDHWYYNAKLHKAFYDKLENKNILLQASSFSHYSWHLLARSASADGHGDLKGYLDERSPAFDWMARNGMPLDVGWYYGYDPNTPLDMYEYVLGATIGYNSSMSFQVSPAAAAAHPFTGEILDLISRYEKLRLSGRVGPSMKSLLRIDPVLGGVKKPEDREKLLDKRRDYRLLGSEGREVFQRVFYEPWREVTSLDGKSNVWPLEVKSESARLGVQVHAQSGPWLNPGPSYRAADALVLEPFDDLAPYAPKAKASGVRTIKSGEAGSTLPGVAFRLELLDQGGPDGKRYALYTADSSLSTQGGWSCIGRSLNPPLDISWHRAIGLWLRGDGQGGAFKLQLLDGSRAADYYIQNNYTGWRYQQLVRPASDPIDYGKVRSLLLYYNGLPGKSSVSCGIAGIKALRSVDSRAIVDPWVEVAGKRFAWKGSLTEGQYLFFWPGEPVRVFGRPLKEAQLSADAWENVSVPAGQYTAKFGCAGEPMMPVRVRVTLQPPERHRVP